MFSKLKRTRAIKIFDMVDPSPEFQNQIINAGILAGFSFFSTLSASSVVDVTASMPQHLLESFIAAGITFFTSLLAQRGLKLPTVKEKEVPPPPQ